MFELSHETANDLSDLGSRGSNCFSSILSALVKKNKKKKKRNSYCSLKHIINQTALSVKLLKFIIGDFKSNQTFFAGDI